LPTLPGRVRRRTGPFRIPELPASLRLFRRMKPDLGAPNTWFDTEFETGATRTRPAGGGMDRVIACKVDELDCGDTTTLDREPPIAVYRNAEGEFFATADTCTHEQWSLGTDSDLDGNEVTCPLHMARFDITSGKALCFPATVDLKTYEVVVEDGVVYVVI
jgi:nitrite reductase/ring-hydroxylating ferredoxin subunit